MDNEEIQKLQELLKIHTNNLWILQKQAAQHGMDVPIRLANEIEHEQSRIAAIKSGISVREDLKKLQELYETGELASFSDLAEATLRIVRLQDKTLDYVEKLADSANVTVVWIAAMKQVIEYHTRI